ncbi:MAG TPA: hemerythrin domain-containing protein [Steroidobacteraceae bacterium]|jgi:hypothetical protein|nr:hemerythrin domain-containing protein [Steroidobacteraceae bacterium]
MSLIDKVVSAVTPMESDEARAKARSKALAAATEGDWLSLVLQHHRRIEAAFAAVKTAADAANRAAALKKLAVLLTGHSIAEEAVLYPAMVKADEESRSTKAYTEQSAAKVQMGLLEDMQPMSQEYLDKLDHLRGAIAHHVYEEEGTWFLELKQKLPAADQTKLTFRYKEQFARYMGQAGDGEPDHTPIPTLVSDELRGPTLRSS